ncbi:hypothetical protein KBZ10_27880 [Streptomyces sp. F63]|uniref:hypothetical protein n=1 Tax=Streptomyces sp. F63 TaxID=2824887 RepID=UPI001B3822AE|nr:hypothetical protein [Streptomyces sp. F63]MBQ0988262.1 hypothetical protein [Streptomyces sp. F63]
MVERHNGTEQRTGRGGSGGIPDGLLVGLLGFLVALTVLVWAAAGVSGLLAHGSWPSGAAFTETPLALRRLMTEPGDLNAAWPGAAGQLSGPGLFWGVLIGEVMVLTVLTVFVIGTIARWRAARRSHTARTDRVDRTERMHGTDDEPKAHAGDAAARGPAPGFPHPAAGQTNTASEAGPTPGRPPADPAVPHRPGPDATRPAGTPHRTAGTADAGPAAHGTPIPAATPHSAPPPSPPASDLAARGGNTSGPAAPGPGPAAGHPPPAVEHLGAPADHDGPALPRRPVPPVATYPETAYGPQTTGPGPAGVPDPPEAGAPAVGVSANQVAAPSGTDTSRVRTPALLTPASSMAAAPLTHTPRGLHFLGLDGTRDRLRLALRTIADAEGPLLVVTSEPALWTDTKDARAKLGPTHVFDPGQQLDTPARLRWSPVSGCETRETAAARATALLAPVRPQHALDSATAAAAETLLRCWLHAAAVDDRPIRQVHRWASGSSAHEPVRILRTHRSAAAGSAGELEATLTAHPERRDMALQLTARALSELSSVHIRNACNPTRADSLALESFVAEGGTLYVVGEAIEDPRTHPGAMPFLTALASHVVEHGRSMAERSSAGRLDPPLTLVLDDIARVAPLPQLPWLMNSGSERGMPTLALLRSQEQARARWPQHFPIG